MDEAFIESATFLMSEANVNLMNTVKDMLQKVSDPSQGNRPTKWVFNVKRDAQGLMTKIEATAQFQE